MRINTNQYSLNLDANKALPDSQSTLTYGEFFAGGLGCASGAMRDPRINVRWVLNHDKVAVKTASFHLPNTKVYWTDIYMQDEHEMEKVNIIQASFECDYHTPAKGNRPIDKQSYMMGWELYRYISFLQPMVLTVENVPGVKKWAPLDENDQPIKERAGEEFEKWKKAMCDLGYNYTESVRCAADDGLATTRTRYFAIFFRDGISVTWPERTHNEFGTDGKLPWIPCKNYINLDNHGNSIFGRKFNENLPKQHRKSLQPKSLQRIGYGVKKHASDNDFFQFIATYYGGEPGKNRTTSIDKPLPTQPCENRHQLITVEKIQFIADHCQADSYQLVDKPLKPQLTRQTKQLVTVEQFVTQYYGNNQAQSINEPLNTIPCVDRHQLVTFEKTQFICEYYSSNGRPESNIKSIDKPLSPVLTEFKHQLVTVLHDFDIKARFLSSDELAEISTFPRDFFNRDGFKLSHKNAVKLIGNAVPPEWFYKILTPNIESILEYKQKMHAA